MRFQSYFSPTIQLVSNIWPARGEILSPHSLIIGFIIVSQTYGTHPDEPFPNLEPQSPLIDEFYLVQERRAKDFKAPKLWKGSSGTNKTNECNPFNHYFSNKKLIAQALPSTLLWAVAWSAKRTRSTQQLPPGLEPTILCVQKASVLALELMCHYANIRYTRHSTPQCLVGIRQIMEQGKVRE